MGHLPLAAIVSSQLPPPLCCMWLCDTSMSCANGAYGDSVMDLLAVLIDVTLGGWILLEILLLVRDRRHGKGGADADRGTLLVNALLFVVETVAVSGVLSAAVHVLVVPERSGSARRVWSSSGSAWPCGYGR